jgi:hypothetical protein
MKTCRQSAAPEVNATQPSTLQLQGTFPAVDIVRMMSLVFEEVRLLKYLSALITRKSVINEEIVIRISCRHSVLL